MIDNYSVLSMLEFSKEYVKVEGENSNSLELMKRLVYEKHWWSHFNYLLVSCFPVFVLYYTLFKSKLVPRIISVFGIFAVSLTFIEEVITFFGHGFGMNMLLPMALIQLTLPIWLIIKGFNPKSLTNNSIV